LPQAENYQQEIARQHTLNFRQGNQIDSPSSTTQPDGFSPYWVKQPFDRLKMMVADRNESFVDKKIDLCHKIRLASTPWPLMPSPFNETTLRSYAGSFQVRLEQ